MERTYEALEHYAHCNCKNSQKTFLISIIPLVLRGVITKERWKMRIHEKDSPAEIPLEPTTVN